MQKHFKRAKMNNVAIKATVKQKGTIRKLKKSKTKRTRIIQFTNENTTKKPSDINMQNIQFI